MSAHPEPRRTEGTRHDRRWLRENWYRDVWLLIITAVVLFTCFKLIRLVDDIQASRRESVGELCRNNTRQDDVLRAILNASLAQARANPRTDAPLTPDEQARLAEQLMAPLGGLHPSDEFKVFRCHEQVERFVNRVPDP